MTSLVLSTVHETVLVLLSHTEVNVPVTPPPHTEHVLSVVEFDNAISERNCFKKRFSKFGQELKAETTEPEVRSENSKFYGLASKYLK